MTYANPDFEGSGSEYSWARVGVGLIVLPVSFLCSGFVIQAWWGWFLVPHGLAPITLAQGMLIWIAVRFLNGRAVPKDTDTALALLRSGLLIGMGVPAFVWMIGWAFKSLLVQ